MHLRGTDAPRMHRRRAKPTAYMKFIAVQAKIQAKMQTKSKTDEKQLRRRFLGWQCRIRQIAVRQDGGRPSEGMRPRITSLQGEEITAAATLLLVPQQPTESTAFFRHQIRQTGDPRQAMERGLAFLQGDHYHKPETFADMMPAVFAPDSAIARRCLDEKQVSLQFHQFGQSWNMPCSVRKLPHNHSAREAALWHNRLWNPTLGDSVWVLGFTPDWNDVTENTTHG